jgi:hypothetical protein
MADKSSLAHEDVADHHSSGNMSTTDPVERVTTTATEGDHVRSDAIGTLSTSQ